MIRLQSSLSVVTGLLVVASTWPVDARADTPQPVVKLGQWVRVQSVNADTDFTGLDLRGTTFVGQNLSHANFRGSDLLGVSFNQCDLRHACFDGALMTGMRINECTLDDADFSDATINGILGPSGRRTHDMFLTEVQLKSTKSYKSKDLRATLIVGYLHGVLKGGMAPEYDFRDANLAGATFKYGDFTASDFRGAELSHATFDGCRLNPNQLATSKDFLRRKLRGIEFDCSFTDVFDFSGFELVETNLRGSFGDARFFNTKLTRSSPGDHLTTNEQLYGTRNYKQGVFLDVAFGRANFAGCDLSGQNLTGCWFAECDLSGANLSDAVITDAVFFVASTRGATKGLTASQIKSTWNYQHGRMHGIQLPVNIVDALDNEESTVFGATLGGRVILNRRPLGGTIRIVGPQNNPLQFTTTTKNDGRYQFAGHTLAPGAYKVVITSRQVSIPKRYNESSQLSVEIKAGDNRADFELTLRSR